MSVYDRWHKTRGAAGETPCRLHSRGAQVLYPTTRHGQGDRWLVRWRDAEGRQLKRSFPQRRGVNPEVSAEAFDAQRTADEARGDWLDPRLGKMPFGDYAPVWVKSRLHRVGTSASYEINLRRHILPAFGNRGLASIRPTMVQQWVRDLQTEKQLAPRTIETIYVIFSSIMRGAVRDGYLRRSPCVDIRLPEPSKTTIRLLTPGQILALAHETRPTRYGLMVLLGGGTGLRQGEALGLALDRVDEASGLLTVDQQVIIVNRRPVLAPPKTSASVREVPLPRFLLDAIQLHVREFQLASDAVLCSSPRGNLLRRDYYNREIWRPAITAAGLPSDTTFHDLRHTFASTALAEGVPISEVSRWLGHKSITTTVDLYGHLVPEASGRARDALNRAFSSASVPPMCPETVGIQVAMQVSGAGGGRAGL